MKAAGTSEKEANMKALCLEQQQAAGEEGEEPSLLANK